MKVKGIISKLVMGVLAVAAVVGLSATPVKAKSEMIYIDQDRPGEVHILDFSGDMDMYTLKVSDDKGFVYVDSKTGKKSDIPIGIAPEKINALTGKTTLGVGFYYDPENRELTTWIHMEGED